MNHKLKIWNNQSSWEEAEEKWDQGQKKKKKTHPLKTLSSLPQIPGITKDTACNLTWKSTKYLLTRDQKKIFWRYFFRAPIKHSYRFISSLFTKSYSRDQDLFFYGVKDLGSFEKRLASHKNHLFVIGFSYCHKPFECPSKRFSADCIHDPNHPVCRQCFIGKAVNALPDKAHIIPLFIPTVHYIGEKCFELIFAHPDKQVFFLITACELTLTMFADWGNMIGIQGIGIRLDGRICNTMKAFELSEEGIKPGLTVVLDDTQKLMLSLIRSLWNSDEKV